MKKVYMRL